MRRPLPEADVLKAIHAVGEDAVLICGQAVAWWATFYAGRGRIELSSPSGAFVSQDIDFTPGSLERGHVRELARRVAKQMRGRSTEQMVFGSRIAASVSFVDSLGDQRALELLNGVFGVSKHREIIEQAVRQRLPDGSILYVMHPVMLLESRVANVAYLEKYQNETGRLQAVMAIQIGREWLRDRLDTGWVESRGDIERVVSLAESKAGLVVRTQFQLDIVSAIPEHDSLPERFRDERMRRCREKIDAAIAASSSSDRGP